MRKVSPFLHKSACLALVATCAFAIASCALPANGNNNAPSGCKPGIDMGKSIAGMDQTSLCIKSKGKIHTFTVEMAATPDQQQKGLMFRTELSDTAGMIFPQPEPRIASFWMKNTVISLDIIFVKLDGKIENIVANTTPYSSNSVSATAPVAAVLELRAGLSAELGIEPGDVVSWKKN